jgi:hypothetical protein
LPIVEATSGTPVTEAANGRGVAVTKVVGKPGLPVTFETIGAGPGTTYATLDAASVTAVALSGGGLVATNTGTTSTDQGAKAIAASGKTSGKYYFEVTWTTVFAGQGNLGVGIGTSASTYTGMGNNATTGDQAFQSGSTYSNGSIVGSGTGRVWASGFVMGIAVDMDNRRIWWRQSPASFWNGLAPNDPTTNVGGMVIPAGTMVPFVTFGGTGGVANNVLTANFGASAFNGAVPSGFTAGWPA